MSSTPWILLKHSNKQIPLTGRIVTFGSSPECHIQLDFPGIVPRVGHLMFSSGVYELQSSGVGMVLYINDKKLIGSIKLKHGDCIRVGTAEMQYYERGDTENNQPKISTSPITDLITAISDLLNSKESALFDSLVVSVARLLRSDAARLVVEDPDSGDRKTLTRYPSSAGLDRFSNRAVDWAAQSSQTVIMHADQWREEDLSIRSLERNLVASVMCAPLRDDSSVMGYIYLDRVTSGDGFTGEDKDFLNALLPLLSRIVVNFKEKQRQKETIERLQQKNAGSKGMIFESGVMQEVIKRASRFARTDSPVLILGETGTGKELMARFIHENSSRGSGAFKAINCGAIPENLIESELFGYEKGAFTGASARKIGIFEAAEGGTVFLDEIGELPLQLQVRLLRVLQESEITRIGGTDTIKINVRIVAATNRNLEHEIAKGSFRQDLYFRLHVLTLNLPPLRERGTDIHLLIEYLTKKYCLQFGFSRKTFSSAAKKNLVLHSWPGNIRELENIIQKAILMSDQQTIGPSDISIDNMVSVFGSSLEPQPATLREARDRAEKAVIIQNLTKAKGNISLCARILDTDRKWLMKKMEEFGIDAEIYR